MAEGNTHSNCLSCLKDGKENLLPVGSSFQVKGSDGNSRSSNTNTAGFQYVNHLHQNADRSDGFNATVDDKGKSGKPFVRISVPVKDGNIGVTVLCVNGIVEDMRYNFNHLNDKYQKHKSNFTVKNAPGVDDIMQNHSELFFDAVEEMEQTHDSTLTVLRKGCLVLEFEHKDEASARAMVADKDKIEKIFKVFAAKCGKEPDDISVEAEYKMYEKTESEVFEPTSLPVEDTLASGMRNTPSVSDSASSNSEDSQTESGTLKVRPPIHPVSEGSADEFSSPPESMTNFRTSTRSLSPFLLPLQTRQLTPPKPTPSPKPDASPFSSYGQTSSNPYTISRPQSNPRTVNFSLAPMKSDVQRPGPGKTPSREQVTLSDQSLTNPQEVFVRSQLTDAEFLSLAGVDIDFRRLAFSRSESESESESESTRGYLSEMTEDEEANTRLETEENPGSLMGYVFNPLSLITSLLRRLGMMKQISDSGDAPRHDKPKKKIVIQQRQGRVSYPTLSEDKEFPEITMTGTYSGTPLCQNIHSVLRVPGRPYDSSSADPDIWDFRRLRDLLSVVEQRIVTSGFGQVNAFHHYLHENDTDLIKTKTEVTKMICAVRNSERGTLTLHIKSHQMDVWKEHCNTFWEPCFNACLLDGELQSDVYRIREDLQNNAVVVEIEPSSEPITCEYNTKVKSQTSLLNPTRRQMCSMMQGKRKPSNSFAKPRGINWDLKEGGNIAIVLFSNPLKDLSIFVKGLFKDLKLSEYISAFSKDRDGGSYFLGTESDGRGKRGIKNVIKGFALKTDQQNDIISLLQENMTKNIIVLDSEMNWSDPPSDLINVAFHPVVEGNGYVIEVAVRPFSGIVFCDKMGPESYRCISGNLERLSKEIWLLQNRYRRY